MANINVECGNCGAKDLRVRTSERVGLRIGTALLVCNVCGSRNHLMWENVRLETPEYHQRDEFLRINKPLIQIDPRQTEIDME
ncbi:hypothetical protein [Actinobacillus porcinus]|uniref:hypothetical protein n=1 Tax=Actinobacillus porcinus TaxID=51048 RepID=UPI002357D364|nr:hypothetical protein [Actinobacillus porcinus]